MMRLNKLMHYAAQALIVICFLLNASDSWAAPAVQNPATGCAATNTGLSTGYSEHTLVSGGQERAYLLYIAESYDATRPAPLVLSLHGFASNPRQQAEFSQWDEIADAHGFLLVFPRGTGRPLRWNAGENWRQLGAAADDVGFIQDLIGALQSDLCVDAGRIYVNGLSNGGGMSHRLVCELSDLIAAAGMVAGAYPPLDEACQSQRPVPIITFHGTEDRIVPFDGANSFGFAFPPVEAWARAWAVRNGCDLTPASIAPVGDVSGLRYGDCDSDAEVVLYVVEGGGHTWPGGLPLPEIIAGHTTRDISASAVMWDFFEAHPLLPAD